MGMGAKILSGLWAGGLGFFLFGGGDWALDMAPLTGLKHILRIYRGFTPAATDVPPLRGSFLWLRIRIYWMSWMGRI